MKKLLTIALALMVLAAFADLGVAQQKGEERKPGVRGAFEETRQSAPGERGVKLDRPVLQMTGKVTGVDPTGKTFTVMSKGQAVTVSAAKLPALPKIGEIIDITYTQTPGGPMQATIINSTKSQTF